MMYFDYLFSLKWWLFDPQKAKPSLPFLLPIQCEIGDVG